MFTMGIALILFPKEDQRSLYTVIWKKKQKRVFTKGFYRYIRHPSSLGVILICLFTPLLLGSLIGFFFSFISVFIIVIFIALEEKILKTVCKQEYIDYCTEVKWNLIPGLF